MDIRYYADTDLTTRQPDGLFRIVLAPEDKAAWAENLTPTGWVHDDTRFGDQEEYGVRPVNEQSALLIAQKVFGQQQLDPPVNPYTHPEVSEPAPAPDAAPPAADQPEGGDQGGGQPKPAPAPPAGASGPGGS